MTQYIIIVALVIFISLLTYNYGHYISNYIKREIDKNKSMNISDEEIMFYKEKYNRYPSKELMNLKNSAEVQGKELTAIEQILLSRQMFV